MVRLELLAGIPPSGTGNNGGCTGYDGVEVAEKMKAERKAWKTRQAGVLLSNTVQLLQPAPPPPPTLPLHSNATVVSTVPK